MFLINDQDISAFGIYLERGALSVFEIPPTPKEPFFNDWIDENGKDYDEDSDLSYQSQDYDIPLIMEGKNLQDYKEKKQAFLSLVSKKGEFTFHAANWSDPIKLRFKSFVKWDLISYSASLPDRGIFAKFTIKLQNNHRYGN
ncbi:MULTISPECIES: hypothetical protein [Sphingobacterium]|uniref:hypothetical protein n=1 Tax=Sphingobacterium TaxID=28453 RepID=UPI00257ECF67|nr:MULTISPECIES: hypothetical protein [Sphingobacterium]